MPYQVQYKSLGVSNAHLYIKWTKKTCNGVTSLTLFSTPFPSAIIPFLQGTSQHVVGPVHYKTKFQKCCLSSNNLGMKMAPNSWRFLLKPQVLAPRRWEDSDRSLVQPFHITHGECEVQRWQVTFPQSASQLAAGVRPEPSSLRPLPIFAPQSVFRLGHRLK